MNIFYLDTDPRLCAKYHCDKHVVKMILESAQLLSTAHRVLDGVETRKTSPGGRNLKYWQLSDIREEKLYKATHVNHPCAVWVRQSVSNYFYLYNLYIELLAEYKARYGKSHASGLLANWLIVSPTKIPIVLPTPAVQAMPDYCKVPGNPVQAYRNYYINEKADIAEWRHSEKPKWYK